MIDWQQGNARGIRSIMVIKPLSFVDNCKRADGGLICLVVMQDLAAIVIQLDFLGHDCDLGISSISTISLQRLLTLDIAGGACDIGGHMRGYYDEELQIRWS